MDPFGDDESWLENPGEFDPDSLGPDVPDSTENLQTGETSIAGEDVDDELFTAFWGAVIFLNVALAALALGAMLLYFRGAVSTGGGALLVGVAAAAFAARYYRRGKRHVADDSPSSGGDES